MEHLVKELRKSFASRATLDVGFRQTHLQKLELLLTENRDELVNSLRADFKKPKYEIDLEIDYVLARIKYTYTNLKSWLKPKDIPKELKCKLATVQTIYEPYGVALIVSPWNYPIILSLEPLIGAIGAGNCCVLKLSELTPSLSETMVKLSLKYLDTKYYKVIFGDKTVATELLEQKFDYIFFTGSVNVGKIVMQAAAKHLTPVTLELGGKCPCYIDKTADLDLAANKVAFAKSINAGQICISVDYVLCHKDVLEEFIEKVQNAWEKFLGNNPKESEDYGRIVNGTHFKRIEKLLEETKGKIVFGGEKDEQDLYIAPTIIRDLEFDDILMQSELFAPILPVLVVESSDEAITKINELEKPLCIYAMASDRDISDKFNKFTSSGQLVINEVYAQMGTRELPFGGVGSSGIGKYHGSHSIANFSHLKSYYAKHTYFNVIENFSLPPITPFKYSIIKKTL